jgi:predicted alpha/beta hydrolase
MTRTADPRPTIEYTQQFLDRGGDRLGVQVYPEPGTTPEGDGAPAPLAVIWPAMGVPARYYRPFAAALRERGLAVVVVDLRGTGASTPAPSRGSRYGYAELVDDVGAVLAHLRAGAPDRPVYLVGHSLGGQAALLHAALTDESDVDGLALVAVGLPYWRVYPRRVRVGVLGFTQAIAGVTALLRVWPGWSFGGVQARGVIRDWAFSARHGRYPRLRGEDTQAALGRLALPVLAISVDDDQFTPSPTVDHLCAMLGSAHLERVHVTAAEAGARLDHFLWVRACAPIAARVAAFVRR